MYTVSRTNNGKRESLSMTFSDLNTVHDFIDECVKFEYEHTSPHSLSSSEIVKEALSLGLTSKDVNQMTAIDVSCARTAYYKWCQENHPAKSWVSDKYNYWVNSN
jgi:hypothetical protein